MLERTYTCKELTEFFPIHRNTILYHIANKHIRSDLEKESGRWTYFLTEDQVIKLLGLVFKTGKGRRRNERKSKKRANL